jgi:hypothetical protein
MGARAVMQWFRLYSRIVDDDKLRLLAFEDRWHFVALCCLKSSGLLDEDTGDLRTRRIAVKLGVQVRELDEIGRRLSEVGLVDDSLSPVAWEELQFRTDNSTERVRAFRKRQQKQSRNGVKRGETVSVTPQETEAETDKKESPNGDSSSSDEPKLRPEHVFEFYQEMATAIGLPVPRDLTPERREKIRHRIAQCSLEDFHTVFARCRGSPFLRGDKGRTPLTVDWLFKKGNFQKVLEGNYDG